MQNILILATANTFSIFPIIIAVLLVLTLSLRELISGLNDVRIVQIRQIFGFAAIPLFLLFLVTTGPLLINLLST